VLSNCGAATNAASILEAQSISSVKDFTTSDYIKNFITSADESYYNNRASCETPLYVCSRPSAVSDWIS